ncbi:MAG: hypothetical protein KA451_15430, partial [Methyloversatilis sp.]|nr:hypothetical protein [Methyloversatilis sp.]
VRFGLPVSHDAAARSGSPDTAYATGSQGPSAAVSGARSDLHEFEIPASASATRVIPIIKR